MRGREASRLEPFRQLGVLAFEARQLDLGPDQEADGCHELDLAPAVLVRVPMLQVDRRRRKQVVGPGAERAIVFQASCLLPWLAARDNLVLAASQRPGTTTAQARAAADAYLDLVGVTDAAAQLPGQLSLGTQQCVSLARALCTEPRFLLLDEPFSQLDSLTRFELQDMLLRVWEASGKTVVMVTHDVDEALHLADRLILMTDGPAATVGDSLTVPFPRPRARAAVLGHPEYHQTRRRVIDFLEHHAHQSRAGAPQGDRSVPLAG